MEKVTKTAKERMEEEQKLREEMQRAQGDLEEFLRSQKALENQKKRPLQEDKKAKCRWFQTAKQQENETRAKQRSIKTQATWRSVCNRRSTR